MTWLHKGVVERRRKATIWLPERVSKPFLLDSL